MERYTLNFTLFSLHILLFTLFLCSPTASSQDGICASIFCGQGTCTTDLQCGNGSPPPPPPPPPSTALPPPQLNLTNRYLGTDCDGLGLLPPGPSEPPSPNSGSNNGSQPPPPPSTSDSAGNGPSKVLLSWRNLGALAMILLAATSTTLV
ncbi:conserved hypothetical protein [Ricinus communis]|uniref:Uncharacterized protein n=1 Tax=Ricinus communis TaxID=3988 RepID=B9RUW9_RICCO|nr:conserved hypothetical protein [Ricinus communis]